MVSITEVNPKNVLEETLYCAKDIKSSAFQCKKHWFDKRYLEGLRLKILKNDSGRMLGLIEYIPAEYAWRPIDAKNYMFIHCLYIYSKKEREKGFGSLLIKDCEGEAKTQGLKGVCAMTSTGGWMANSTIFENNGYQRVAERGRFQLMCKKWDDGSETPKLLDWTVRQTEYQGWHLLYADQCPWHEKSVEDLLNVAMDYGIDINVKKLTTVQEAKNGPSGFGVFGLLHNGKLLEDHYISATRFRNILKKELKG